MRKLLAVAVLGCLVAATSAQEAKVEAKKVAPRPPQKKAEVTLKVGDTAPPIKATKWMQGEPVTALAPGNVYVVEFWATWCGPCIVMMPHMSDLQTEYKAKGVTIIGFTAKDPNNSEEKVAEFVKKRGPKLKYTFAYADDRDTNDAWMKAAGRNGIPCCFVVGRDSRIAYIGHPMYLDVVLPKVVAGNWKNEEDNAAVAKIEAEVDELFKATRGDAEAGLKAFAAFEAKHPPLSHIPYFLAPKMTMMLKTKKFDEAKKFAEEVSARAVKQDDPTALRTVSAVFRGPDAKDNKELLTISVNAAEAALKLAGDKDWQMLYNAADAYFAAGDKAKAKEYAAKVTAAIAGESEQLKTAISKQLQKYTDEKKD